MEKARNGEKLFHATLKSMLGTTPSMWGKVEKWIDILAILWRTFSDWRKIVFLQNAEKSFSTYPVFYITIQTCPKCLYNKAFYFMNIKKNEKKGLNENIAKYEFSDVTIKLSPSKGKWSKGGVKRACSHPRPTNSTPQKMRVASTSIWYILHPSSYPSNLTSLPVLW